MSACWSATGRRRSGGVLVTLELTDAVLAEAVAGGYDTILTHHPLLFSPLSSVVESRPRERMVRELDPARHQPDRLPHQPRQRRGRHRRPSRRRPWAWRAWLRSGAARRAGLKFVGFVPGGGGGKRSGGSLCGGRRAHRRLRRLRVRRGGEGLVHARSATRTRPSGRLSIPGADSGACAGRRWCRASRLARGHRRVRARPSL